MYIQVFPYELVQDTIEPLREKHFIGKKNLDKLLARTAAFKVLALHGRIAAIDADRKFNLTQFFRCSVKGALKSEQFRPDDLLWKRVEQRFMWTDLDKSTKNAKLRTFFRIDAHKFVVPELFTFGQRTVPQRLVHLIDTTSSPICVYKLSAEAIRENRVVVKESTFKSCDQVWYDRYVLQPYTRYQFDAGITYVFVTPLKTLFSLRVLGSGVLKFGEDPFQHRQLLKDPYRPPTLMPMPLLPQPIRDEMKLPTSETIFLAPTPPPDTLLLPTI